MDAKETYRAYWFELESTGNTNIDAILQAIARAGKAYHSTADWHEKENGLSHVESIQLAATTATLSFDALLAENAKLKQTIETMKANERERYTSAAKSLGVVAPCDRAALLNEKGE